MINKKIDHVILNKHLMLQSVHQTLSETHTISDRLNILLQSNDFLEHLTTELKMPQLHISIDKEMMLELLHTYTCSI